VVGLLFQDRVVLVVQVLTDVVVQVEEPDLQI
jgi:hypothetical protein